MEGTEQGWVIETVVSPFHCLYQDALHFHTQSQPGAVGGRGEPAGTGGAAALLSSAEALVHQAAVELGRPELAELAADPPPPAPGRCLAAPARDRGRPGVHPPYDPGPPLAPVRRAAGARTSWAYPGPPRPDGPITARPGGRGYEPLEPHQVPPALAVPPTERSPYPAPACPATHTPCGPAISTPRAASSTPPSRPSTAASAAPATTSATARSRSASSTPAVSGERRD